jgi:hypothetical protein
MATAYITATDLINRLKLHDRIYQLVNVTAGDDAGVAASATVISVIAEANGIADGYIRARHDPADVMGLTEVKGAVLSIAIWKLSHARPESITELDRVAHDDAMKWFRDVAKPVKQGGVSLTFPAKNREENLGRISHFQLGSEVQSNPNNLASSQSWFSSF